MPEVNLERPPCEVVSVAGSEARLCPIGDRGEGFLLDL